MANDCKTCLHKERQLAEGGHCYMFEKEMPDCQQHLAQHPELQKIKDDVLDELGKLKTRVGTIGHIDTSERGATILIGGGRGGFRAGFLGILASSLNTVGKTALGPNPTVLVKDKQLNFGRIMPDAVPLPMIANPRREGKSKRPKKW